MLNGETHAAIALSPGKDTAVSTVWPSVPIWKRKVPCPCHPALCHSLNKF